jgi:hypothetical protein
VLGVLGGLIALRRRQVAQAPPPDETPPKAEAGAA